MEEVVGRANLVGALKRVRQNKGSPGIDGMSVEDLPEYLRRHWGEIRQRLLAGTYQPKPVRRQEIPKSGGGVRELGIPTVLDRFIQQAILQVATEVRPDVQSAQPRLPAWAPSTRCGARLQEGAVDLEKFFDRVNHDVLMGRLAKRSRIRRCCGSPSLPAGVMANGVVMERHMPQGGPLSPLLAPGRSGRATPACPEPDDAMYTSGVFVRHRETSALARWRECGIDIGYSFWEGIGASARRP